MVTYQKERRSHADVQTYVTLIMGSVLEGSVLKTDLPAPAEKDPGVGGVCEVSSSAK